MAEKIAQIKQKYNIVENMFFNEHSDLQMLCKHMSGDEKVLVLGDYSGYHSLVINEMLKNKDDMVTLEPYELFSSNVQKIRDDNGLVYNIENAEICCADVCEEMVASKHECYPRIKYEIVYHYEQFLKHDVSYEEEAKKPCNFVTMTFSEITTKYNIEFDTIFTNGSQCFFLHSDTCCTDVLTGIKTIFLQEMRSVMPHIRDQIFKKLEQSGFNKIDTHHSPLAFAGELSVWRKI